MKDRDPQETLFCVHFQRLLREVQDHPDRPALRLSRHQREKSPHDLIEVPVLEGRFLALEERLKIVHDCLKSSCPLSDRLEAISQVRGYLFFSEHTAADAG